PLGFRWTDKLDQVQVLTGGESDGLAQGPNFGRGRVERCCMEVDDLVGSEVFGMGMAGKFLSQWTIRAKDLEGPVIRNQFRAIGNCIASQVGIIYTEFLPMAQAVDAMRAHRASRAILGRIWLGSQKPGA